MYTFLYFINLMYLWLNYIIVLCYQFLKYIRVDLRNQLIFIVINDSTKINFILSVLKYHSKCLFLSLIDLTAIDCLSLPKLTNYTNQRFKVVYVLVSHYFSVKIVIECFLSTDTSVASSSCLYKASSWLEREVWDMFGIFFSNHPDLRRILTDYGFEGFPLRKDFPISGYSEIRYDDTQKCIVYESLELTQEYRIFDSLSPWSHVI